MGLRNLFQRRHATTAHVSSGMANTSHRDAPLTEERQDELRAAWAELTKAAGGSKVISFHACTRTGQPWTEDPAAVRDVAATLRDFPASDSP